MSEDCAIKELLGFQYDMQGMKDRTITKKRYCNLMREVRKLKSQWKRIQSKSTASPMTG